MRRCLGCGRGEWRGRLVCLRSGSRCFPWWYVWRRGDAQEVVVVVVGVVAMLGRRQSMRSDCTRWTESIIDSEIVRPVVSMFLKVSGIEVISMQQSSCHPYSTVQRISARDKISGHHQVKSLNNPSRLITSSANKRHSDWPPSSPPRSPALRRPQGPHCKLPLFSAQGQFPPSPEKERGEILMAVIRW